MPRFFLSRLLLLGVSVSALVACSSDSNQGSGGGGSGVGGAACGECGGGGMGTGGQLPLEIVEKPILPSDGALDDRFGSAVALSGERLLVGAAGVDDVALDAGGAYVFERDAAGDWVERAKLTTNAAIIYDSMGEAVALDGDVAVVGGDGTLAPPDNVEHEGAYVFERAGDGSWSMTANLKSLAGSFDEQFGHAVALSGDVVVVGAPYNQEGNSFIPGAVYVFERQGSWQLAQEIFIPGSGRLGSSVAIDGNILVAGAPTSSSSAHVFERGDAGWTPVAALASPAGEGDDGFGGAVAVVGNRVVVGANVTEVDGKSQVGTAHIFERDEAGAWNHVRELVVPTLGMGAQFGSAVAGTSQHVLVGAPTRNRLYLYDRDLEGTFVDPGGYFTNAVHTPNAGDSFFGSTITADGPYAAVGGPFPEWANALVGSVGSVVVYEGLRVDD